jgi:nucleotide-binding universal stress UspA family protein
MRLIVRSRCPVAIIGDDKPPPAPESPVIAGIDGSDQSAIAVGVAVALAMHHNAELQLIHVAPSLESGADADVERMLTTWRALHRYERSRVFALEGRPADVLIQLSDAARAVVVGSRGRGGFVGFLIGSVSRAVIAGGCCPVIVVPSRMSDSSTD